MKKLLKWIGIIVGVFVALIIFIVAIIIYEQYAESKKTKATIKNLNESAENGSLLSTIGFVVMKAEDQSKIKIKGNSFTI